MPRHPGIACVTDAQLLTGGARGRQAKLQPQRSLPALLAGSVGRSARAAPIGRSCQARTWLLNNCARCWRGQRSGSAPDHRRAGRLHARSTGLAARHRRRGRCVGDRLSRCGAGRLRAGADAGARDAPGAVSVSGRGDSGRTGGPRIAARALRTGRRAGVCSRSSSDASK